MLYDLPAKPAIRDAITMGRLSVISERLRDLAIRAGYVLGPGGISVHADGSVSIDADRDPSADWDAWNVNLPSDAEDDYAQRRTQAQSALAKLQGGGTLSAAERRGLDIETLEDWLRRHPAP